MLAGVSILKTVYNTLGFPPFSWSGVAVSAILETTLLYPDGGRNHGGLIEQTNI